MDIQALKLSIVRRYRDQLLSESDWLVLPDSPLAFSFRQAWIDYRQYLRDLPNLIDLSGEIWTDEILRNKILPPPPLKAPAPEEEPS